MMLTSQGQEDVFHFSFEPTFSSRIGRFQRKKSFPCCTNLLGPRPLPPPFEKGTIYRIPRSDKWGLQVIFKKKKEDEKTE